MRDAWQRRIDRANELARADARAAALLTQYAAILAGQRTCYDALIARGDRLTGSLARDLAELRPLAADLYQAIAAAVPAQAMRGAPAGASAIDALLSEGWRESSIPFLARVVLQPYAEALTILAATADGGATPTCKPDRALERTSGRAACPFCDGPPQVAALTGDATGQGGGRALVCATCSTTWPVGRILCAHCGEADEHKLGYFQTADFAHVRIDACETCRRYIKAVDLTKLGLAVPLVDEVASGALDLWAHERGYRKLTPNLIGL